ncbi:MAG TPA: prepilin peptidase [Fibrobacteria bacterium]|nr:prepilin peptidase [Fibrobacteria bacterium]
MDYPPLPPFLGTLFGGVFGLMVGSFFNVVIYRMPRGESVAWPPSRCMQCGYRIKSYENIPVLSWLLLRGKCKSCGTGISVQYPLIEALTGLIAALVIGYFLRSGAEYPLGFKIGVTFLVLASIPIFVIDFRHFLIPDLITYPGMALGLGLSFLPGALTPLQSLTGGAVSGLFLWLVGFAASLLLKKEAMGLGDVKLMAMSGALFGTSTALSGLIFASALGCLVGLPMMFLRKLDEHRHIPFGPYICVGVFLSAFYGQRAMDWYMGMLGW